jgi:hypothetical protein
MRREKIMSDVDNDLAQRRLRDEKAGTTSDVDAQASVAATGYAPLEFLWWSGNPPQQYTSSYNPIVSGNSQE